MNYKTLKPSFYMMLGCLGTMALAAFLNNAISSMTGKGQPVFLGIFLVAATLFPFLSLYFIIMLLADGLKTAKKK